MSILSDKYYSKEELLNIAKEKGIDRRYFDEFILFIEKDIQQITYDNDFKESEMGQIAIDYAVDYFNVYDKELQKGHSKEWAKLYADSCEEHPHAFNDAYFAIKEVNPKNAIEELIIHCNSKGGDELYTKHFIFLMEQCEGLSDPDKQAFLYSKIYKEEISKGRSHTFAHEYADFMAEEKYSDLFCLAFASEYEKTTNEGKTLAAAYAHKIASYIANHYYEYEEALSDELYLLEKNNIEKELGI